MLGHNGQDGELLDFLHWFAHSLAHGKHAQCFHFPAGSSWIVFILVFLQPDFGSAIIIFLVWLSMVLFSGISKKHLLIKDILP